MSEKIQIKDPSPLVKAVLALDAHYSDLLRLGERIEGSELKSNFDYEQAQLQMEHFAKAGQGVSENVVVLAEILMDIRNRAESTAANVAKKAEVVGARKNLVQQKMQEYAQLGEQVRELNSSLQDFAKPAGETLTDEEKETLRQQIARFDARVQPLIGKAEELRDYARETKIKELEQSADSLGQRLKSVSQKLLSVAPSH